MRNLSIFFVLIYMFYSASCNNRYDDFVINSKETDDNVSYLNLTPDEFFVSTDDAKALFSLIEPDAVLRSIKPIGEDGVLSAYMVQCNQGWYVVSSDKRCNPVLVSSDDGAINLGDTTSITVKSIYGAIHQATESINSDSKVSPLWSVIDGKYQSAVSSKRALRRKLRRDGMGMWIPTDTTVEEQTTSVPHLITTLWTQGWPYNAYCPYITYQINEHCAVGCIPLAVGMTLCHMRENEATNVAIPSAAHLPAANYVPFIVDSYSSSIWSQLRTNNNYAAMFLAQMGSYMGTSYGALSLTYETAISGCLSHYGVSHSILNNSFMYQIPRDNILAHKPVICCIGDNGNSVGHTFIIDACTVDESSLKIRYVWDPYHVKTEWEIQIYPQWMFEPIIGKDGELTEFEDVIPFSTKVTLGTNMCLETLSRPSYVVYQKYYAYTYHDETGSYNVPQQEYITPISFAGLSSTHKMFYNLHNN